jgi:hypothetical protein
MHLINGWKAHNKSWSRFDFKLRIGFFTIFDIHVHLSHHEYSVTFLNFRIDFT